MMKNFKIKNNKKMIKINHKSIKKIKKDKVMIHKKSWNQLILMYIKKIIKSRVRINQI